FIPCVIAGAVTNIAAGLLVSRIKANHLALAGALASTIAPVVLANMNVEWSYWRAAFWAMCLIPLSADGILTQALTASFNLTSFVYYLKFGNHLTISCPYTSIGWGGIQHCCTNWELCRFGDYFNCCSECNCC